MPGRGDPTATVGLARCTSEKGRRKEVIYGGEWALGARKGTTRGEKMFPV